MLKPVLILAAIAVAVMFGMGCWNFGCRIGPYPFPPRYSLAAAAGDSVSGGGGINPIEMVFVEGGTFTMGCTAEQAGDCLDGEKPAHKVTVSNFFIGKYEVTYGLYKSVMGDIPSYMKGDDSSFVIDDNWPVVMGSVREFILKLNAKTGKAYRLPTEAEWEYAARGGNKSKGYKYSGSNNIDDVAWYGNHLWGGNFVENDDGNSGEEFHPVGTKAPNELGIHDMSGSVQEWVSDYYGDYSSDAQINPTGPSMTEEAYPLKRGGSWSHAAWSCRVSYRYDYDPEDSGLYIGFRLAMSAADTSMAAAPEPVDVPVDMVFVRGGMLTGENGDVAVSDFFIGKVEVTQGQWTSVMGGNPSYFTGNDSLPVERVNWNDIQKFIERLNVRTGKEYRLPGEDEWEFAARGGNESKGYKYSGGDSIGGVAWYKDNSGEETHPVGAKQPNELGIYDMSGNVDEWVNDWRADYRRWPQENPQGPESGKARVRRGGEWSDEARFCRVSRRSDSVPFCRASTIGSRLAHDADPPARNIY